jgi:predicted outer membrane repeat protein
MLHLQRLRFEPDNQISSLCGPMGCEEGGLVLMRGSTLTVDSCVIAHHIVQGAGGAISLDKSQLRISAHTLFEANTALHGGAVSGLDSSISIRSSKFVDNTAIGGDGGAISLSGSLVSPILEMNDTQFSHSVRSSHENGSAFVFGSGDGSTSHTPGVMAAPRTHLVVELSAEFVYLL